MSLTGTVWNAENRSTQHPRVDNQTGIETPLDYSSLATGPTSHHLLEGLLQWKFTSFDSDLFGRYRPGCDQGEPPLGCLLNLRFPKRTTRLQRVF